jgi:hypothetical protein
LKQVPVFPVAGTVSGISSLKKVQRPWLVDHLGQPILQSDEFNEHTGAFTFKGVPAGTYIIRTQATDEQNTRVDAARSLNVDGPINGLNLAYGRAAEIPLIVREEFTQPPSSGTCESSFVGPDGNLHITKCSDFSPIMVELKIADTNLQAAMLGIGLRDDPSSKKFSNIVPGRYSVSVLPRSRGYVASVQSGTTDLLQEELIVPDEGAVPPIEVLLRDDTADVEITVSSEKPGQSISTALVPRFPGRTPIVLEMRSGEKWRTNIPPGEYTAFALEAAEGADLPDRDVLDKYTGKGTHITVLPNSKNVFSLELIHP